MGRTALLRRLILVPPTLLGVAVVVFVLLRVVPGDPIAMMIPPGAGEDDIARLRALYGLDQSIPAQFVAWLGNLVVGDFGTSISLRQSVTTLILGRLPATLELVAVATLIAVVIGGVLALIGAFYRRRAGEWAVDGVIGVVVAVPDFLWGLILILIFGVLYPVLPISGRIDPRLQTDFMTQFYVIEALLTGQFTVLRGLLSHILMPAIALALPLSAIIARVLKASLGVAEGAEYAQMARARGFSRRTVLLSEALPNAAIPTVTLTGVQFTFLVGGTVLIERIFSYEGIGNMAVDAVINRDLPLIQGIVLTFAVLFIAINLAIDLLVTFLNPRLRRG
ncbi:ABC transporter permease [Amorphus orientalis]|uniref:Peptide/nickel transport system permease protein n=1 Tax=Amorphus orientalis TaxID=649198 RepID=A0AAE4ARS2_9HYPH|nr:ABC transporter permease [Amorphus orientalis]MDQ0315431.1 peptide/nickel transport system permease protein [Amorphus orientalis]